MGRPRTFDETEVVKAAAGLFASRAYDGISVDDLVGHLGVHRNSLYKVFGSKRGLYLAAVRWHLRHQVRPVLDRLGTAPDPVRLLTDLLADDALADFGLLELALAERAPVDAEIAGEIAEVLSAFDSAVARALGEGPTADAAPSPLARALTAAVLGLHLRARIGTAGAHQSGAALVDLVRGRP